MYLRGSMNNFFKTIYFEQVKQECEFCLAAVEQMNKILEDEKAEGDFLEKHWIWYIMLLQYLEYSGLLDVELKERLLEHISVVKRLEMNWKYSQIILSKIERYAIILSIMMKG